MQAYGVSGTADEGQRVEYAPDVVRVPTGIVNAYLVGHAARWVLVDTGMPGFASVVRRSAEARFGARAKPVAIVLTHGHFDHSGNVDALAAAWDVPVYAHALELAYLAGRSQYPPQDPTVGGAMAFLSRAFPRGGQKVLKTTVLPLPEELPGLGEWRWLHTPGHTAGHISLFRDADRMLLAGDAVLTVNVDAWSQQLRRRPELCNPPAPLTADWEAARDSVHALAALAPCAIGAGHGLPAAGPSLAAALRRFEEGFAPPVKGRYVTAPASMGPAGLEWIPPAVPDVLARQAAGAALLVMGGLGFAAAKSWRAREHAPAIPD
ncbi:MAG TPA: MBL fold metallo-hydrolase [Vicinamibacterales bacterium]|nr:MBL fold metallo-hydrolase [Vicinamibacterales bacterium]